MTLTFLSHQWKSFWRSKNTGKSIAISIVLGIFILYMLVNLLFISFFIDVLLVKIFPGKAVLISFSGLLLYYFLIELLARYQFQELPTLRVQPYLGLPLKRSKIVNFLCFSSLWSGFTLAPFLLTVPFLVKVVLPAQGAGVMWGFIAAIAGISLFNHFFTVWFKRKESLNVWYMLIFLISIAGIIALEFYWHLISVSKYSTLLFSAIVAQPLYSLALLALGVLMYYINYVYLKGNLYLDEFYSEGKKTKSSTEYPFLNRFGKVGDLAANELKLILRNKRPKATVTKGALIFIYGFIFYGNPKMADSFMALVFCPMLMTGMFIISYGQFMFGWQSSHFDGILVNRVSVKEFFRSKFLLFTIFSTAAFIITTPYGYYGWKVVIMQFVMYIWNLGVNTLIALIFANLNYKRIDLSKGASFNWEGVGITQWLLTIPLMAGPYLIFLPFKLFGYNDYGLAAIGIIGLIFILLREVWLTILVNMFNKNRYKIAEGFRNE